MFDAVEQTAQATRGTLLLVVGPSGVGKDTLIASAHNALKDDPRYNFPRRVITRAADAGGEDHIAVDEAAFICMLDAGYFSLHWSAHGLHYALPWEVAACLAEGTNVIVNVSRAVVDLARLLYPPVRIISVTAPERLLAARLAGRKRESPDEIRARFDRRTHFLLKGSDVVEFSNEGSIDDTARQFLSLIAALSHRPVLDPACESWAS